MSERDKNPASFDPANSSDLTIPPARRAQSQDDDQTLAPSSVRANSEKTEHLLASGGSSAMSPLLDVTIPPAGGPMKKFAHITDSQTLSMSADESSQASETGRHFGDYLLIDEIARGGMGVVYKARQIKLKRNVALKMIVAGELATPAAVERFRIEAEAAAQLDHPGIVPIFEVGEINGQHFFSMGYVDGGNLGGKLKDGPLAPREAAIFLRKIADAVAYAHEKRVVHRDLKPANILIDKAGEPKITDFGLAKQIKDGEEGSSATTSGEILGTPSYMPPEQAAGRLQDIGPISDVYSLGAILYALLTGRPPFQAASIMDTLMQVLEHEPVPPSQLNAAVPKDLETICLKCLQKDTHRRYASAVELRDELDRFLANEPIRARPISRGERVVRWCKRKPALASLIAAMIVLAIGSFAAIVSEWRRAEQNFRRAEEMRVVSENRLRETQSIVDKYFTEVSENVLLNKPGMFPLRHQLFRRALEYYQHFVEQEKDNPKLQLEMANAYLRLGGVSDKLVRSGVEGVELYQKAIDIFEAHLKSHPDDIAVVFSLSLALNARSTFCAKFSEYEKGLEFLDKSLRYADQAAVSDTRNIRYADHQAGILTNMGTIHSMLGHEELGAQLLKKAVAIRLELLNRDIDVPMRDKLRGQLAGAYMNLASMLPTLAEGRDCTLKAIQLQKALCDSAPEDVDRALVLGHLYYNFGVVQNDMNLLPEAATAIENGNAVLYQLIRDHPTVPEYRSNICRNSTELYRIRLKQKNLPEAANSLQTAIDFAEWLIQAQPKAATHRSSVSDRYRMLGEVQLLRKQDSAALLSFEAAERRNLESIDMVPDHDDGYRRRVLYCQRLAEYWDTHGDKAKGDLWTKKALESMTIFSKQLRFEMAHANETVEYTDSFCEMLRKRGMIRESLQVMLEAASLFVRHGRRLKNGSLEAQASVWYVNAAVFDPANDAKLKLELAKRKEEFLGDAVTALKAAAEFGYKDLAGLKKTPNMSLITERADVRPLFESAKK